jgi:cell division protein ZipA
VESDIGEIEDLFAIPDVDFDRPIHEILDMNLDEEPVTEAMPSDQRAKPKSEPKPKPRSKSKSGSGSEAPKTDSLFDILLDQVEEAEEHPLEDIESLVEQQSTAPASAMAASATDADSEPANEATGGRQVRQLDFSDPDLALAIFVVAPKGQVLPGVGIRKLAEACGMEFGQQNLFHRFEDKSDRSPIQFSMSDAVKPGYFDLDTLDEYQTPAVSLFMSLAESRDPMYAYECMLATAETLAKNLNAELLDSDRSVLRNQTKEHYREQVSAYQLKQRAKKRSR